MQRSSSLARHVLGRTALAGRRARRSQFIVADKVDNLGLVPESLSSHYPAQRTPLHAEIEAEAPKVIPLLPGARTLDRRIKFGFVNVLTLSSITLGMMAIFLSFQGHVAAAAVCVIACVAFDGLDGGLARKLGVASPFGAQMDSMADMASFGIATPVMVYAWLHTVVPMWLLVPACVLIAACSAMRLARFNVSPKDGRYFCGVPTTIAAAILAMSALLLAPVGWYAIVVAILALLMVSTFPYVKIGRLLSLPRWLLVLPILGGLANWRLTFLILIGLYLVSGPLITLAKRPVPQ
nr:CDP-alcohol phosphatidyltransferase family protein [Longispora sp. (in: high G+C Gram-positive bacteria)]